MAGAIGGASSAVFWLVAARRFTVAEIGVAGGVASLAALVNVVTSLGFTGASLQNVSNRRGDGSLLLEGSGVSAALSILGSAVVVVALQFIPGPFSHLSAWELLGVLSIFSAAAAIGTITDVVGGPLGSAWLAPARALAIFALRLVWILGLSRSSGPLALVLVFAAPTLVTAVLALGYLVWREVAKSSLFRADAAQRAAYWKFALHSLPSTMMLNILPVAPPIIAVWVLGAHLGGVFYICWSGFVVGNLIVAAATVLGMSGDVDEQHLVRTVRRIAAMSATLMALIGPFALLLYGRTYFTSGWLAVFLLGVALWPYAQVQLQVTLLRRAHDHMRTTRITSLLCAAGIGSMALGGTIGTTWAMAAGWLLCVSAMLFAGTQLARRGELPRWLPSANVS